MRFGGTKRIIILMCIGTAVLYLFIASMSDIQGHMTGFAEEVSLQVEVGEVEEVLAEGLVVEVIRSDQAMVEKRVLIYHTHTYEAYEQNPDHPYRQIDQWRTEDEQHNVVAVGKALASQLSALGIQVTHDTTAFEPPTLDQAYSRSLVMLEKRMANGERYDLYIDLHRDALASASAIKRTVNVGGEEVARLMVLVGKGTTGGYEEKPDFAANQAIARNITNALNNMCQNLARDVKIKTGRFNQHIADCCVLIECGTNWNTLDEVLAAVPYLAQAISDTLNVSQNENSDGWY